MKKSNVKVLLFLSLFTITSLFSQEENTKKVYIKPYGGFIGIQNMSLQLIDGNQNSDITVENGFGFTAGISVGYNFFKNISTEIGWEYKSNTVEVINNTIKSTGDYASNFIYLNGIYNFSSQSKLQPYLGFGLSYIEEIDLDFGVGENTSFSKSGNLGYQGIAGLDFNFSKKWALNWELKYVVFKDFDMNNEANNSTLAGLTYAPLIFNIGIKYKL